MAKPENQLALFENELEKLAAASMVAERSTVGTQFLSTKSGVLTYRDNPIANNQIEVVILSSPVERLYYTSRYDPTKPAGPVCFALGSTMSDLKPNVNATEKQFATCSNCPKDQWGSSANGGKGKACAEKRRLLIMTADTVSSVEAVNAGEVAALRTPVTSVRGFATYLQKIASTTKRPLSAVVTRISVVPDAKTQFKVNFDFVRTIDDINVVRALIARSEKELANAIATAGVEEDTDVPVTAEKSSKY
jgi:hypothetical protein